MYFDHTKSIFYSDKNYSKNGCILMSVYYDDVLVASNDDSASGLYGISSEVNFTPNETGDYVIAVTSWSPEIDGYTLTADLASSESFCGNDWWPRE